MRLRCAHATPRTFARHHRRPGGGTAVRRRHAAGQAAAARPGAHFSAAPFLGAAIAILARGDRAMPKFWLAAVLMKDAGVWPHPAECQEHLHTHRHRCTTSITSTHTISTGTEASRTPMTTATRRSRIRTTRTSITGTSIAECRSGASACIGYLPFRCAHTSV